MPPATGIVHQVNLEFLAKVVQAAQDGSETVLYPDTLVGTDSHTTMINALGVLGWGVDGIEAEAVMLGQPYFMLIPEVVGVRLSGEAVDYLASGSEMGFGAVADPEPWLEELGMPGSVLDPTQLIDAAALIEAAYDARQTLAASRERWPLLAAAGANFVDLRPVAGAIRRAILPSGAISDGASPELQRLPQQRVVPRE